MEGLCSAVGDAGAALDAHGRDGMRGDSSGADTAGDASWPDGAAHDKLLADVAPRDAGGVESGARDGAHGDARAVAADGGLRLELTSVGGAATSFSARFTLRGAFTPLDQGATPRSLRFTLQSVAPRLRGSR